jgi:acyl-coenzyme A synthetase/AMP-(fatty) acid ligase
MTKEKKSARAFAAQLTVNRNALAFRPTNQATLRAIHEHRPTALYGVPTMMISCLNHPSFKGTDISSLRGGIMAVRA